MIVSLVVNALAVLANVLALAFYDGGPLNWIAIALCSAFAVASFFLWRSTRSRKMRGWSHL